MSYPEYKFARLYISGLRGAPIDIETLSQKQFLDGFINRIEPRMIAKNVSFFSDYTFNQNQYIFTGVTDIFDSNYSSIKLSLKNGYINVIDSGITDVSGFFKVSGYVTGEFIDLYVDKVHAGYNYSLYLYNNKTYLGFGVNPYNQLGPQNLSNIKEIQAGTDYSLLLFEDGTITGFGNDIDGTASSFYTNWSQTPVGKLSQVSKISTQNSFSMALFNNGTITGWGNNFFGQASGTTGNVSSWSETPLSKLTGVININAGNSFGLALFSNGTITGWGNNFYGQVSSGLNITGVINISAGENHSLALLGNGKVTGWGDNTYGQALGGNSLDNVIDISAGWDHNLALLSNGKVTGWGNNTYGQALNGNSLTGATGISAGRNHSLVILNNKNVTGFGSSTGINLINYEKVSNNIIYKTTTFLKSENLKMDGGEIKIGPPIGYREKTYIGTITGIAIFNDYFYNAEDQKITFIKKTQFSIPSTGRFQTRFDVLNTISINGEIPTINTLDSILRGKTAFVSEEQDLQVYGYIQNYPLLRNNVSSFGLISGTVSGIGTGIIDFNKIVSGMPLSATANQIVGYKNASGVLNYNDPVLGDFIILTNDSTGTNFNFIYETGEDFTPPIYFNSIDTLNNIINSGSADFEITSKIDKSYYQKVRLTGKTIGDPTSDNFGYSTSLNSAGNVLAVGAYTADTNNVIAGAVYIFTGSNNSWAQAARLTGSTIGSPVGDNFGFSTSLNSSGNVLAVGAYTADTNNFSNAGAVYIFTGSNNSWAQAVRLTGNTPGIPTSDLFGASTSLNSAGNVLAVGAYSADTNSVNAGAVYIFTGRDNSWAQAARLTGNTPGDPVSDNFGYSTSLNSSGNILAVGAPIADTNSVTNAGAVYIFTGSNDSWAQAVRLTGNTPGIPASDRFGWSTSLNSAGNVLAVGAYLADTNSVTGGAVYIFTGGGNNWNQTIRLTGNTPGNPAGDIFGYSTSLNSAGNVLAVGAYLADTNSVTNAGAVYIFTGSNDSWAQAVRLTGNTPGIPASDLFGYSTSLNDAGDVLAVGAYSADTNSVSNAGAVYMFNKSNDLILESLIKGEDGNFFRMISQGSSGVPLISGEYFKGGITYRNPMTPTGIFTGLLNTGLYVTGYFEQVITGALVKDITGLIGYRPFTGLWDLYEILSNNNINEYINIKTSGVVQNNSISTNDSLYSKESINRKKFSVSYSNSPDFASTDVAILNISLNSGISGYNYNIILTGSTQLNTQIIIPSGNTVDIQ